MTDSLIQANYFVIMPLAQGLTVSGYSPSGTVTSLLTTSESAFSKTAGYSLDTYEKEDGDADGPFSTAISCGLALLCSWTILTMLILLEPMMIWP